MGALDAGERARRFEFVRLAQLGHMPMTTLCHRYGISRPTGYAWVAEVAAHGTAAFSPRSRQPHTSPRQTPPQVAAAVEAVRRQHPTWGGEKIAEVLRRQGVEGVPSGRTCTEILRRAHLLEAARSCPAFVRFEADAPNDLWQLDFKGPLPQRQGKLWVLSVLDDHSRFLVGLVGCPGQTDAVVRDALTPLFGRYGLPWRILTDNGPPWGNPNQTQPLTRFSVWLIRLGIAVSHGRPYHPQTQGKVERFQRTLQNDVLATQPLPDRGRAQRAFATFRTVYNQERPHAALGLVPPAERYTPSPRSLPDPLPPIVYPDDAVVRMVKAGGQIALHGRDIFLSQALAGEPIALRATPHDGLWQVQYCHQVMGLLDETSAPTPRFHVGVTTPRQITDNAP